MADGTIRVAPDSTGSYLHTRTRTVAAQTVHEQVVTIQGSRVVTGAATAATFRIPARAATSQVLASGLNNASATNLIQIRRIAVEVDTIVAKAVLGSWLRIRRITAQTGGTAWTPTLADTGEALAGTGLTLLQDASADGTNSTTALSSTQTGVDFWQQVVPRMATQAGIWNPNSLSMLPDDGGWTDDNGLVLRAGQGFQIRLDSPAALTAGDFHFGVKIAFEEYTAP